LRARCSFSPLTRSSAPAGGASAAGALRRARELRVVEDEPHGAEADEIAVREPLLEHALLCDARAVRAPEVAQQRAARVERDLRVLPRHRGVEDLQRVARPAPDREARRGDRDRLAAALAALEAQRVASVHAVLFGGSGASRARGRRGRGRPDRRGSPTR
jgi:hypothetical protein